MADFYCDISAVGTAGEYETYAAIPTTLGALATDRPRPMDGSGKAKSATAASVAVAELIITTLPTDGQTLSIGGSAAITAKTTVAAKNQFAIGASIATATTNLTALLNTFGTTNNTCDVAAVATVSQALLAIPYLYYARVKPGTTNTIQLFTRIAGADFNTSTNSTSKVTQTGSWLNSGAASINFTEGVDGPFGYFVSTVSSFGKNIGAYGIYPEKSAGATEPGISDVILVRVARDGASFLCSVSNGVSVSSIIKTKDNAIRNFVIDNLGETWAGDTGVFKLFIENTGPNNAGFSNGGTQTCSTVINATAKDGFFVEFNPHAGYPGVTYGGGYGTSTYYRCKFDIKPSAASWAAAYPGGSINCRMTYVDCKLVIRKQQTLMTINGNYDFYLKFYGGSIEYVGIGSHVTALFNASGSPSVPYEAVLDNLAITVDGGVGGYGVNSVVSNAVNITTGNHASISVIDCTGFNSPSIGLPPTNVYPSGTTFIWQNSKNGAFRREKNAFTTEFVPGAVYPSLDITDRAGSPMACRVSWEFARLLTTWQLEAARFSTQYRGSDAINTCDLELITPSAMVPKETQLAMVLTYTSADGVLRNETTITPYSKQLMGNAANLPNGIGLGAWTLNGLAAVESRKLSIRTAYPIKQGTIVTSKFMLTGPPTSGAYSIYISPDIRFTL